MKSIYHMKKDDNINNDVVSLHSRLTGQKESQTLVKSKAMQLS